MTRILSLFARLSLALALGWTSGAPDGAFPGILAAAAQGVSGSEPPPSLEQRRRDARERKVRRAVTLCRVVAEELSALKNKPCASGDRLNPATNVCYAPRNIWKPYVRWDPAAGRCKPRDAFDGVSCVGSKQRYKPGRRYAQSRSRSASMYGHATAQLASKLAQCRHTTTSMKHRASNERTKNARICRQARKLGRADLVAFYCQ